MPTTNTSAKINSAVRVFLHTIDCVNPSKSTVALLRCVFTTANDTYPNALENMLEKVIFDKALEDLKRADDVIPARCAERFEVYDFNTYD
jgi:hypothetical protein